MTSSPTAAPTAFPPGTFAPAPQRASRLAMVKAQGLIETKLLLRHGEQQLLSVIIPIGLLIAGAVIDFLPGGQGIDLIFPMVLAVAATSAGFTGQAIAVAFDRRYGALKRTGASGVSRSTIVSGKIIAVIALSLLQIVLLGFTAYALGFRTGITGIIVGLAVLLIGVGAFTAMGLSLGGSQSPELVLALANLLWFIMLGIVGWVMYSQGLGDNGLFTLIPTVAVAAGIAEAFAGVVPVYEFLVLVGWLAIASFTAMKCFRFEG
ncbi:ABC transporter permease [Corynebacterium endometrii]|nr:ABC transporter permease [Corynebacterium endometrii]